MTCRPDESALPHCENTDIFRNSGKRRVVRRVIRRTPAARTVAPRAIRRALARVLMQPIARRVSERDGLEVPGKISVYGGFEFNHELHQCFDPLESVMIAGTVDNMQSMVAVTVMSKVDLVII